MICPNCKYENPEGVGECIACHIAFDTVTCPQCKGVIGANSRFCYFCGFKLQAVLEALSPVTIYGAVAIGPSPSQTHVLPAIPHSQTAQLLHISTQQKIEIPRHLTVIHVGKPNAHIPPDIDVSGFAHANVVSRVQATIYVEGSTYFIEDAGSSNGTYLNNLPLIVSQKRQLQRGDQIVLGQEKLMTFLFIILNN